MARCKTAELDTSRWAKVGTAVIINRTGTGGVPIRYRGRRAKIVKRHFGWYRVASVETGGARRYYDVEAGNGKTYELASSQMRRVVA